MVFTCHFFSRISKLSCLLPQGRQVSSNFLFGKSQICDKLFERREKEGKPTPVSAKNHRNKIPDYQNNKEE